jgi:AcrR family transcriptional regulator
MPKVLPDIQNRILSTAETHFDQHGFENTEMREIANELDISVGTIYLHFQNKEELYRQVIFHNWRKTQVKLIDLAQSRQPAGEAFREMLIQLADDMAAKQSHHNLWMEIGTLHHHLFAQMKTTDHFSMMRESISEAFNMVLRRIVVERQMKIAEQTCRQLGSFTFIMVVDVCMKETENIKEQINLIEKLILSFLESK